MSIFASLNDFFNSTYLGDVNKSVANNLYGIDQTQTLNLLPKDRESQGYIFIVRPQLNMRADNLKVNRKLVSLLSEDAISMHRYVRCLLDPRLMVNYVFNKQLNGSGIDGRRDANSSGPLSQVDGDRLESRIIPPIACPLVDNKMAFFSILTNNVITASGMPEPVLQTFQSKAGRYGESVSMVDSVYKVYENYSYDITFKNTISTPILYLFHCWYSYMSSVFSGEYVPYPDFIAYNRLDYTSRIFRIRLDSTKRFVTKIASTGPAIPVASSIGKFLDLNVSDILKSSEDDVSVKFNCTGVEIFDPILKLEFNKVVCMFNKGMKDGIRDSLYIKLDPSLYIYFRNKCYPRINLLTDEFEWWIEKSFFNARATDLIRIHETVGLQSNLTV